MQDIDFKSARMSLRKPIGKLKNIIFQGDVTV
jgi:hypothetical protein